MFTYTSATTSTPTGAGQGRTAQPRVDKLSVFGISFNDR